METVLNALIRYLITHVHLHVPTIWVIFESLDTRLSPRELEHYVNEYKQGKAQGIKFYKR